MSTYTNNNNAVMYDKNGLPIYGMDAELALKQAAKYDPVKEQLVRDWIEAVTGEAVSGDFQESLKDGIHLCKLANKLVPGAITKINTSKLPFMQMENINNFLNAIEQRVGVPKHDSFRTVDLYEGKNIVSVIDCLYMLASHAQKLPNYKGPQMGVKIAEKKEYVFTEEQLRQAKAQPTMLAEASIKGDFQKSIKREVVKTTNAGDKTALGQQYSGSIKGDFQRSIKREVVKVKDAGDKTSVAQQFQPASIKGDFQKSIKREVVKVPTQQQQQEEEQPQYEEEQPQYVEEQQPEQEEQVVEVTPEVYEALQQLEGLYQQGVLTEEEFEFKRNELLSQ